MSQASVRSIDALRDFRVALALFAEEVLGALGSADMEVRRTVQWLQHDQRMYWQSEIKRRREKVSMAQSELHRRKLGEMFGHAAAYSEQKELLKKAEDRLREAEARAAMVKKWLPTLQQAALEYQSKTRRLNDLAGGEMPLAQASLERIIASLERYTALAPPSVPPSRAPDVATTPTDSPTATGPPPSEPVE